MLAIEHKNIAKLKIIQILLETPIFSISIGVTDICVASIGYHEFHSSESLKMEFEW